MIDIERLLDQTARSAEATPSPEVVEADVRRARSALLQRRRRRAVWTSVASTVAVAAVIGAAVVMGADPDADTPSAGPNATHSQGQAPDGDGIDLVTYHGEQPPGFIVHLVPEGWYVQQPDHGAYSLAIAPDGDTSSPDAFVGKLVVMLDTRWPKGLPEGEPIEVNGHPGVIYRYDSAADQLIYEYGDGRVVVVQAWNSTLNWYDDQLVRFAEGITVTASAKAGVG